MPINPRLSRLVSGYVPPTMKARMRRIAKAKPRMTLSFQIEEALRAHLPELEAQCGFKAKSGERMP